MERVVTHSQPNQKPLSTRFGGRKGVLEAAFAGNAGSAQRWPMRLLYHDSGRRPNLSPCRARRSPLSARARPQRALKQRSDSAPIGAQAAQRQRHKGACGAVAEWSKAHAWKVCIRQKRIEGSNPSRSAINPQHPSQLSGAARNAAELAALTLAIRNRRPERAGLQAPFRLLRLPCLCPFHNRCGFPVFRAEQGKS